MNETIDIDNLVSAISAGIYGDDRMSWSTIEAATTALSQLVEEVERLRELLLNAGWPREAEGLAVLALRYERAAVVAWLRERHTDTKEWDGRVNAVSHTYDHAADCIERGEHRREEE